jgi:uncharacterized protein (TIGR01319 family)
MVPEEALQSLRSTLSIPDSDKQRDLQLMLSRLAVKTAVDRHAGRLETVWTHDGDVLVQRGKDLSKIETILGTGGPLAFSHDAKYVLEGALATPDSPGILKPTKPNFYLDTQYIMFAAGLLAQSEPDKALRIIKKYIKEI